MWPLLIIHTKLQWSLTFFKAPISPPETRLNKHLQFSRCEILILLFSSPHRPPTLLSTLLHHKSSTINVAIRIISKWRHNNKHIIFTYEDKRASGLGHSTEIRSTLFIHIIDVLLPANVVVVDVNDRAIKPSRELREFSWIGVSQSI